MLKALLERIRQGHRTGPFPRTEPVMPDRFLGLPALDSTKCAVGCAECIEICPTDAITMGAEGLQLDMGRCLFCGACAEACPAGALAFTRGYSLASRTRQALLLDRNPYEKAQALDKAARRVFGHSLKLRQVSAGGCNACEADTNVLNTLVFDLGRFGIQFVAAPRHADGLLITGPVTQNMGLALRKTYEAVPAPKFVVAVGACAISGGPYAGHDEVHNGAEEMVPVDLYIPGCPPHPYTILDGLLRLIGRR